MSDEKPRRKKRRYENEQQITDDIDITRKAITRLNEEAAILDRFADVMFREFPNWNGGGEVVKDLGGEYRVLAEKFRARANRFQDRKLPRLSQALATLRTGIFPMIITDKSIQKP